jgi:HlyD family secretion protein
MRRKRPLQRRTMFCVLLSFAGMTINCDQTASKDFLGSAVAETRTYLVATTEQGTIAAVFKDEGRSVVKNELLAIIDTVQLMLARQEVLSNLRELGVTVSSQEATINAITTDVAGVEREFTRTETLVKKGSAPEQQRDNLGTQLQSSQMKLVAARRSAGSLQEREKGLRIKLQEIDDRLRRCRVLSPANGTVLTRYRNAGEVIGPGNPIMEVGEIDTLYADFFVPQPMLATLACGQKVRIRLDYEEPGSKDKARYLPAVITWIGSEAEFSPKNIQTRQSRNELVFRVRATIPNTGGMLKRGLPCEVWR